METTIASLTPAEVDTALAAIYDERDGHYSYVTYHQNEITRCEKQIDKLQESDEEYALKAIDACERIMAREYEKIEERMAEIAKLREQAAPYEARYAAERWSRFYLVQNGNGHVHQDMCCTTCFVTTSYGWLYECSGMTEEEIVAEFGEKVCTVCYPSAPVTPGLVGRRDREAQEAKAAEKAAKLAAKLEKAILPDGSPLRLSDGTECKTLISAQRELSQTLQSMYWYGESHPYQPQWEADVTTLANAIAAKLGGPQNAMEILNAASEKARKKVAKERA